MRQANSLRERPARESATTGSVLPARESATTGSVLHQEQALLPMAQPVLPRQVMPAVAPRILVYSARTAVKDIFTTSAAHRVYTFRFQLPNGSFYTQPMRFSRLRTLLRPMVEEMVPWFEKDDNGRHSLQAPINFPSRGFPGIDYIHNEGNAVKRRAALALFLQQLIDLTYDKAISSPAFHQALGFDHQARAALIEFAGPRKVARDRKEADLRLPPWQRVEEFRKNDPYGHAAQREGIIPVCLPR